MKDPRYRRYHVLYLALHGTNGKIWLGKDTISLFELAEMLDGAVRGGAIHFGSCLTLEAPDAELKQFAKRIGASGISGYSTAVDWLDAAVFEAVLLERLLRGNRTDAFFRGLRSEYGELAQRLGLVAATPRAVYRPAGPSGGRATR